jgi:pre-60S factor REI1
MGSKKHAERERAKSTIEPIPKLAEDNGRESSTAHDSIGIDERAESTSGDEDITARLASARRRIQPTDCLFCSQRSDSVTSIVDHMSSVHSFFIPEREHLLDLAGLLGYLGEKVVVGNICLFCPNGGREFSSLEAVRKHMVDKNHCKMAFETDEDVAETSDYYDWRLREDQSDSDWEDTEEVSEDPEGSWRASVSPYTKTLYSLTSLSVQACRRMVSRLFYPQAVHSATDPCASTTHRISANLRPRNRSIPTRRKYNEFGSC